VVYYQDDWFYANWVVDFPFANNLHINELEAFSVVLEILRWAADAQLSFPARD
jgi:hypothetical protein